VPQLKKARIESVDEKALQHVVEDGADPTLADLDPDQVARIVGTVDVLGQPVEIATLVTLELDRGKASIAPRDVRLVDGTALPLPAAAQRALLERFKQPLDTGALPLQVTPKTFEVVDGTLAIGGTAANLTIGG